jgi:hypothetical protein
MMTNLEVLSDFTNKPLEGKLSDKELRRFLVAPDLTKSDGTGAEPVGLLYATSGVLDANDDDEQIYLGGLPGGLGCELFTRCFT